MHVTIGLWFTKLQDSTRFPWLSEFLPPSIVEQLLSKSLLSTGEHQITQGCNVGFHFLLEKLQLVVLYFTQVREANCDYAFPHELSKFTSILIWPEFFYTFSSASSIFVLTLCYRKCRQGDTSSWTMSLIVSRHSFSSAVMRPSAITNKIKLIPLGKIPLR